MSFVINRVDQPNFMQIKKNEKQAKQSSSSSFADEMSTALNQLSKLDDSAKLRENAVSNGKAIIKNWTPPTNQQLDTIFQNIKKKTTKAG